MAAGLEQEVNFGVMSTTVTRMPYCICYVRHIDGIEYHLNEDLAPKYVDVIEHNNIRTIDRAKNRRLQALKVVIGYWKFRPVMPPDIRRCHSCRKA